MILSPPVIARTMSAMQQTDRTDLADRLARKRTAELLAYVLEHYPHEGVTLHERSCPILLSGRCACRPVIVQPTASA